MVCLQQRNVSQNQRGFDSLNIPGLNKTHKQRKSELWLSGCSAQLLVITEKYEKLFFGKMNKINNLLRLLALKR